MYNFSLPKVDGVSTQPAAEMNSIFYELEGIVTDTGQSLSNGDNTQLEKAVSIYAGGGAFFTDSGVVNSYVLSPIGSKKAPPAYFDGMLVRFLPGNTNTSSATINVNSLGAIAVKRVDGTVSLRAGDIVVNKMCTAVYNATHTCFIVLNPMPITARAYQGSSQLVTLGSTDVVEIDTISSDLDGFFDIVTHRFTPVYPYPLKFEVEISCGVDAVATNSILLIEIFKNGSVISTGQFNQTNGSAVTVIGKTSDIIDFNGTTDYIDFRIFVSGANNVTISNQTNRTFFTARQII